MSVIVLHFIHLLLEIVSIGIAKVFVWVSVRNGECDTVKPLNRSIYPILNTLPSLWNGKYKTRASYLKCKCLEIWCMGALAHFPAHTYSQFDIVRGNFVELYPLAIAFNKMIWKMMSFHIWNRAFGALNIENSFGRAWRVHVMCIGIGDGNIPYENIYSTRYPMFNMVCDSHICLRTGEKKSERKSQYIDFEAIVEEWKFLMPYNDALTIQ